MTSSTHQMNEPKHSFARVLKANSLLEIEWNNFKNKQNIYINIRAKLNGLIESYLKYAQLIHAVFTKSFNRCLRRRFIERCLSMSFSISERQWRNFAVHTFPE